jgi:hypothetical protein
MNRRALLLMIPLARFSFAANNNSPNLLRGKLAQPPTLETGDGRRVALSGDAQTAAILKDKRLAGFDFEIKGHYVSPAEFAVDPLETHAMLVYKAGKPYRVTYYCDVCSIRTYSPGPCMCCQQETRLDLIDPSKDV